MCAYDYNVCCCDRITQMHQSPDARQHHTPTVERLNELLDALKANGYSDAEVARVIGVHRNHIGSLRKGCRTANGKVYQVRMTYPEQFILESLAEAGEAFPKK